MIEALISGKLVGDPVRRTSTKGTPYVTAQVRVAAGSESFFVGVTTFSESAGERLMKLSKGSSVAAAGTLEQNVWIDRDGHDRRDWRLTCTEILSVQQARRRREAVEEETE